MLIRRHVATFAVLSFLMCSTAFADVRLPHLIGNHMVLQRDMPIRIWGWAEPDEKVAVALNRQQATGTTNKDGKWEVTLPAMSAGGPYELLITGKNQIKIDDVLLGEVWICSGQSNMNWVMSHRTTNFDQEIAAADHPQIRLFTVPEPKNAEARDDFQSEWYVCSSKTVGYFSAVAYYFGRELNKELKVPVGLVVSAVPGTRIEPWTPGAGVELIAELKDKDKAEYSELYNSMIRPLTPLAIRGAIWYQGEGNVGDGFMYYHRMRALVGGWRKVWGQGDFPFYYVQLAPLNWGGKPKDQLPQIWEAQTAALDIPNTGMAVTNDIGNTGDAHPRNKLDVGKRLANWALARTYGNKSVAYLSPLYESMRVDGNAIRVRFSNAAGGLASRNGKPLSWFTIAGADQKFVPAEAKIDGDEVVVSSPEVTAPVAVRFGWHQIAEPNLMNKDGLPASSFRTDKW